MLNISSLQLMTECLDDALHIFTTEDDVYARIVLVKKKSSLAEIDLPHPVGEHLTFNELKVRTGLEMSLYYYMFLLQKWSVFLWKVINLRHPNVKDR